MFFFPPLAFFTNLTRHQTPVIHVLDASRSVTVVGALLSDRKADYVEVSVGDGGCHLVICYL